MRIPGGSVSNPCSPYSIHKRPEPKFVQNLSQLPLGPKLLHYITLLFRINFPDYVIIFYITELVLNSFLDYVISGVVSKYTMWTLDYIT